MRSTQNTQKIGVRDGELGAVVIFVIGNHRTGLDMVYAGSLCEGPHSLISVDGWMLEPADLPSCPHLPVPWVTSVKSPSPLTYVVQ